MVLLDRYLSAAISVFVVLIRHIVRNLQNNFYEIKIFHNIYTHCKSDADLT